MKVEILYFPGCPNHQSTAQRVREVAQEMGVDVDITERDVTGVEDPAALGFRGSPTVLIDGKEIESTVTEPTAKLGCRTFSSGTGVPEKELLMQAMAEAARDRPG